MAKKGRGRHRTQRKAEEGRRRHRRQGKAEEGRGRQVKAGQGRGRQGKAEQYRARQRKAEQYRARQGKAEEERGKRGRTRPGGAGGSVPVQGAARVLPPPSSAAPLLPLRPPRHGDHAGDAKPSQKQCASWSEPSKGKKDTHSQLDVREIFPLPLSPANNFSSRAEVSKGRTG